MILAVPIILANLTQPIVSAVDTGVAGHLPDASYLGGVALGGLFFNFIFWGFGFLRMGTTGLTAQAYGARDTVSLALTLARAVALALSIGVLLLLFKSPLLHATLALLGGSAHVQTNALVYCNARIWSAPLALANYALLGYFLGVQRVRLGLLLQVFINLVNIAAVMGYVFGLHAGIAGIGWAAASADACGFVAGLVLLRRVLPRGWSGLEFARLFEQHALRRLMLINLDLFLRTVLLLGSFAWFAHEGAKQGDVILAANAILLNFQTFMAYALDGFANASEALVGQAIGAKDRAALLSAIGVSTFWAALTAAAFAAAYALFGAAIIGALTNLDAVAQAARRYLPWAAISPILSVWGFQLDGVFIGATRTRDLLAAMTVCFAVFAVSTFVLESRDGNDGLWLALLIFMAARGLTLAGLLPRVLRDATPNLTANIAST